MTEVVAAGEVVCGVRSGGSGLAVGCCATATLDANRRTINAQEWHTLTVREEFKHNQESFNRLMLPHIILILRKRLEFACL